MSSAHLPSKPTFRKVTLLWRCSVRSVLTTKSPLGTEYRTENPFCCGLRTSGKREVCLKKRWGQPRTSQTPENIEAVRRSVLQSPRRSACKHHANNGHHLQDILFRTMWFRTFHVVVSESKNRIFISQIVFVLFTLKFMEVILPHSVQSESY